MSFYEALTLFLSSVAILVSVGRSASNWIIGKREGERINVRASEKIGLTHHYGRLWLVLHLQIENVGKIPVAIAKLECAFRQRDNGQAIPGPLRRLAIQTYYAPQPGASRDSLLFIGTLNLKPGDIWQNVVRAYGAYSEQDEEKAQLFDAKINEIIGQEWEERRRTGSNDQSLVAVTDETLLADATAFANENLQLQRGKYELFIAALSFDGAPIGVTKYSFSISDYGITLLRAKIDDLRYGSGGLPYRQSSVEPTLSAPESGEKIINEYKSLPA